MFALQCISVENFLNKRDIYNATFHYMGWGVN